MFAILNLPVDVSTGKFSAIPTARVSKTKLQNRKSNSMLAQWAGSRPLESFSGLFASEKAWLDRSFRNPTRPACIRNFVYSLLTPSMLSNERGFRNFGHRDSAIANQSRMN